MLSSECMEALVSGNDEQMIIFEDIHQLSVLGVILFLCEILQLKFNLLVFISFKY